MSEETPEIRKLGKYIIESEIGQGAMGVIYKAFDPRIERTVALKTIRKGLLEGNQDAHVLLERFKREARSAGNLNHPNIVAIYEYDEDGETAFIAMEYVRGRSMKEIFDRNERFDLSDIIRIMSQILGALAYAHQSGIVHRDIKPANILVMENGQIKITDFGIAHVESSELTQSGMVIGTPSYMSPEQFTGVRIDGRADLFCAGVVLYQLVTAENPFYGRTMATIMHKVLNEEPIDPADLNLQVSSGLSDVIRKAIAKKPEDRYQTAEIFFQAINSAVNNALSGRDKASSQRGARVQGGSPDATVVLSSPENPRKKRKAPAEKSSPPKEIPSPSSSAKSRKVLFGAVLFFLLLAGGIGGGFWWYAHSDKTSQETGYGYLNIITNPWTAVYVDGQPYGNTPIARLKLPAGEITVRFVNENSRIDRTETITIVPDEITRKRFVWR